MPDPTPADGPRDAPPDTAPPWPEGGDAVCWLAEVCAECGALNESPTGPCWRCGADRAAV